MTHGVSYYEQQLFEQRFERVYRFFNKVRDAVMVVALVSASVAFFSFTLFLL